VTHKKNNPFLEVVNNARIIIGLQINKINLAWIFMPDCRFNPLPEKK